MGQHNVKPRRIHRAGRLQQALRSTCIARHQTREPAMSVSVASIVACRHTMSDVVQEAVMQTRSAQPQDSIPVPREDHLLITKHGGREKRNAFTFNILSPPYYSRVVRSLRDCATKRDEIRPPRHSGSQELFAQKPANSGDFRQWTFGERGLSKG